MNSNNMLCRIPLEVIKKPQNYSIIKHIYIF